MEISIVADHSIKLRGKQATILIHPVASVKSPADGVLAVDGTPMNLSKVEGSRLTVIGAGEYEIAGVKITTHGNLQDGLVHVIRIDNLEVLFGKSQVLEKEQDKLKECAVAIIQSDEVMNQSVVPALSPRVLVLYGDKAQDTAKGLGKENSTPVNKVQAVSDKLPAEMEVVVLG